LFSRFEGKNEEKSELVADCAVLGRSSATLVSTLDLAEPGFDLSSEEADEDLDDVVFDTVDATEVVSEDSVETEVVDFSSCSTITETGGLGTS
jgi:hypothetical protein